jgi:hypothetical protein
VSVSKIFVLLSCPWNLQVVSRSKIVMNEKCDYIAVTQKSSVSDHWRTADAPKPKKFYLIRMFLLFLWRNHSMDNLPQKKSLVFLGLFYSFRKKKQLCRRIFFNSSPFSSRQLSLKTQFFYNNTTRSGWIPPKKPEKPLFLNFQIEFSRRKWARIEKISSTKLFLFAIRIK